MDNNSQQSVSKPKPFYLRILELLPVIAFFVTYKTSSDLVLATVVVVSSCLIVAFVEFIVTREVSRIQIFTIVLVLLFGVPTILFHDPSIIKWKVTVSNLILSLAIFVFQYLLKKNTFSYLLGRELPLPADAWKFFGSGCMYFFLFGAVLNVILAFFLPDIFGISSKEAENIWVYYKSFGNGLLNMVFVLVLVFWMYKRDPNILDALSDGLKQQENKKQS